MVPNGSFKREGEKKFKYYLTQRIQMEGSVEQRNEASKHAPTTAYRPMDGHERRRFARVDVDGWIVEEEGGGGGRGDDHVVGAGECGPVNAGRRRP